MLEEHENPYDKFELLGEVYWRSGKHGFYRAENKAFDKICLDDTMVLNHIMTEYGGVFKTPVLQG